METPRFVGIDVAKSELVVAALPGDERWTVENDEKCDGAGSPQLVAVPFSSVVYLTADYMDYLSCGECVSRTIHSVIPLFHRCCTPLLRSYIIFRRNSCLRPNGVLSLNLYDQ